MILLPYKREKRKLLKEPGTDFHSALISTTSRAEVDDNLITSQKPLPAGSAAKYDSIRPNSLLLRFSLFNLLQEKCYLANFFVPATHRMIPTVTANMPILTFS